MPPESHRPRITYRNEKQAQIVGIGYLSFGLIALIGVVLLLIIPAVWSIVILAIGVGGVVGLFLITPPSGKAPHD
ncbi:hypothetical protein [Rhodococcus sp. EPR-134]|uniref:hypothetical protein n=1 Tax=Rhodococcus sp. EPR-134 TaxID=1813675 RepID=UPI0007BC33D8|nr:hypothetical protein [Rhodococcus sp. EPR-134]KZF17842.1 hypothetical protein A2J01_22465 [Rhodococcus sp. EPR-134]